MTLEYRRHGHTIKCVLTACPACGQEFTENGGSQRREHISKHTPEDFGLSPLGEMA